MYLCVCVCMVCKDWCFPMYAYFVSLKRLYWCYSGFIFLWCVVVFSFCCCWFRVEHSVYFGMYNMVFDFFFFFSMGLLRHMRSFLHPRNGNMNVASNGISWKAPSHTIRTIMKIDFSRIILQECEHSVRVKKTETEESERMYITFVNWREEGKKNTTKYNPLSIYEA